jgi:transposase InsO family protein
MFPNICKTDQLVSVLRTDNGGEYEDTTFQSCLRKKGIHHETSAPRTLQHNGVAEGDNSSNIVQPARTFLYANRALPLELWLRLFTELFMF